MSGSDRLTYEHKRMDRPTNQHKKMDVIEVAYMNTTKKMSLHHIGFVSHSVTQCRAFEHEKICMTNWMYLYLYKVHILDISSVVGINPLSHVHSC